MQRAIFGADSLPIGSMVATWIAAAWLPAWVWIMANLGIASDTKQFSAAQAWGITAVTLVSPIILLVAAWSFATRVSDNSPARRATGIACIVCMAPYPITLFLLFALWFWNVH